jgi:hypothetical protein
VPNGASGWKDAYAEYFRAKVVFVMPDNDDPGRAFAQKVALALQNVAAFVEYIGVPEPHKDITEYLSSVADPKTALDELIVKESAA